MDVTAQKTGDCQYVLNLVVANEQIEKPLLQAAQRLNRRRPLPGYRPGKAPYALVERMFGKERIYDEMLGDIGDELYRSALEKSELKPFAQAGFDIVQLEPLTIKITVPTEPVVNLGSYGDIQVQVETVTVGEEEIDGLLSEIQQQHALWVPAERPIKMGDQVQLNAHGTSPGRDDIEQRDLVLEVTEGLQPTEFREALLGMKQGETKEFDIAYPSDFRDADLAGRTVHFQATVNSIKEKELPAIDDALAQSASSFERLDLLREDLRSKILGRKQAAARETAVDKALDALVALSTIEYPAVAVEHELADMLATLENRLTQQGFTLDGYLRSSGKTHEQLRDETRPQAEKRLQRSLAMLQFAQVEGISVEKAEIDHEIDRMLQSFGDKTEAIRSALTQPDVLRSISSDLLNRKILDQLLAIATGAAQPRSANSTASDAASTNAETRQPPSSGE